MKNLQKTGFIIRKTKSAFWSLLTVLFSFSLLVTSCENEADIIPSLKEQEISDLIFLREEEKLAHDVYIYSFNKYNQPIFSNIANSELTHTNSVLLLLDKYGIEDPVGNSVEGVFRNSTLQSLYDELTTKSDLSLIDALEVGATIEELDIDDITNFVNNTTNFDLISTYDNLSCGSRNHLRSFMAQLDSFTPSFLSQSDFDDIINSEKEQCGR